MSPVGRHLVTRPQRNVARAKPGRGGGVTAALIEASKARAGGRCPICLRVPRRWDADHSHRLAATHDHGEHSMCVRCFRGMVCSDCNSVLAFARDSVAVLLDAAEYLRLAGEPG